MNKVFPGQLVRIQPWLDEREQALGKRQLGDALEARFVQVYRRIVWLGSRRNVAVLDQLTMIPSGLATCCLIIATWNDMGEQQVAFVMVLVAGDLRYVPTERVEAC